MTAAPSVMSNKWGWHVTDYTLPPEGRWGDDKGLNYDETRYICDVIKEVRIYIRWMRNT